MTSISQPVASYATLNTKLSALVAKSSAAASLANLALVIPTSTGPSYTKGYQPLNALDANGNINFNDEDPPAMIFHYEGENKVSISSDITDHFVEDNTVVVDQIGLKPEMVTVTGYIGELNNVLPDAFKILQTTLNSLIALNVYAPKQSNTAQIAYNEAVFAYESAKSIQASAVAAWTSISGASGAEEGANTGVFTVGAQAVQNLQQKMFQQFYGYWNNRVLFNIQTPWAIFTNMAIKDMNAIQDSETRMISSFEVTFKKIRTAQTTFETTNLTQGKAATQGASLVSTGTTSGNSGFDLGGSITSLLGG